jgi:competence ComEA-like helix-hairpin-helix protein
VTRAHASTGVLVCAVMTGATAAIARVEPGDGIRCELDVPRHRVDLATAGAPELALLPEIGPSLAQAIVKARDARAFATMDDLRRVKGLGEAKFEALRGHVRLGRAGDDGGRNGR